MPANVEIKARLEDFDVFHTLFKKVYQPKEGECKTLEHCDTFFKCNNGRLKLREIKCKDEVSTELIHSNRNDAADSKAKRDHIVYESSTDAATLKEALLRAHGKQAEVKKTRLLYTVEQTRVSLDKVEGIGQFVELEVRLRDAQTTEDGQKIADEFLGKLNITPDMLVEDSYVDLLDQAAKENGVAEKKGPSEETKPHVVEDKEMTEVGDAKAGGDDEKEKASSQEAVKATAEEAAVKPAVVESADSNNKETTPKPAADEEKPAETAAVPEKKAPAESSEKETAASDKAKDCDAADKSKDAAGKVNESGDQKVAEAIADKEMKDDAKDSDTKEVTEEAEKMDMDDAETDKVGEVKVADGANEAAVDASTEA